MEKIENLIARTPEQEVLCKEMESVYEKMQGAGIAFAINENGSVVAYNASEIEDCADVLMCCRCPDGYEEVCMEDMRALFQVWVSDTLCVKRT